MSDNNYTVQIEGPGLVVKIELKNEDDLALLEGIIDNLKPKIIPPLEQ